MATPFAPGTGPGTAANGSANGQAPQPRPAASPAKARPRVSPGRWLTTRVAVLGGARADGIKAVPGAAEKYIGMALVMVFTAAVAGFSAAYALVFALNAWLWAAVVLGAFWGLMIFNLDRYLIVTLSKNDSARARRTGIMVRFLLAAVIATTVSTPLTLRLFQPEINQQLASMHTQQVSDHQDQLAADASGRQIATDQAQRASIAAELSAGTYVDKTDANRVAADQRALATAQSTYDSQSALVDAEANGTGPDHAQGCEQICQTEEVGLAHDQTAVTTAQATLTQDLATQKADNAQIWNSLTTKEQTLTTNIASLGQQQANDTTSYAVTADSANGLLARLDALWRLGDEDWTSWLVHGFIFLLFFGIEVLPITAKAFQLFGTKTPYEDAVDRIDETALTLHNARMDLLAETARVQKQAQLTAAQELNQQILDAQRQVFDTHLKEWIKNATPPPGSP